MKREIDEELRFHLEQRTAENLAAGMSSEEAARAARKRFGNFQSVREECREKRVASFGEATLRDLRFAFRQLLKNPGFTAAAVLTLALGIGATTAIYGVVDQVLLRPLPYRNSDKLVLIAERDRANADRLTADCPASYFDWREQSVSFTDVAAVGFANFNLSGVDVPERLQAGMTTVNLFSMLGVHPLLGRDFRAEEAVPGKHFVVMISHAFWQRHFGGDPQAIGSSLFLNGRPHTVIGVLPPRFHFEHPVGLAAWAPGWGEPDVWRPLPFDASDRDRRDAHYLLTLARLKPGTSLSQARADSEAVSQRVRKEHPDYQWGVDVAPWQERVVGQSRPALLMLSGAEVFMLLIACANVAHLLMARGAIRQREFAVRIALGASRWMIARLLLGEGLLLSVIGSAFGLVLASGGMQVATRLGPVGISRLHSVHLDFGVFGFAMLLCASVTVAFGLVPWLRVFRVTVDDSLREGSRSASESLRRNPLRSALIVAEVASAFVLLSCAGLLIHSYFAVSRVDPGFQMTHILALDVSMVNRRYADPHKRIEFVQRITEAARTVPGVKSDASIYGLPLGSMINLACSFSIAGAAAPEPGHGSRAAYRMASPGYFQALDVPLIAGRDFTGLDTTNTPPVVIVNTAFVRQFIPNRNPIGQRLRVGDDPILWEIVGVVGDVKSDGLDVPTPPEMYRPLSQDCDWWVSLVARVAANSPALEKALRQAIGKVDPDCPVYNIRSLDSQVLRSLNSRRFTLGVIGLFAAVALGLAAVGVYGVLAYSVNRRTREIGIRMALGAERGDILRLVIGEGLKLTLAGVCIGVFAALGLTRLLASLLWGVSAFDPATFAGVSALLIAVALFACWLPACRAAKVDPMTALRYE